MLAHLIDQVFRREGAGVLATLIRVCGGDFDLAEDALQDTYEKAIEVWSSSAIPDRPAAWLTTVGRRRALDLLRRRKAQKIERLPDDLAALATSKAPSEEDCVSSEDDASSVEGSGIDDDRLRLLFTCCHPALSLSAQVALALRTLCGLTTREIARAFVEPEATTAQRIVRAKKKIVEAKIPYEVARPEVFEERLEAVLSVVYLVYNEGHTATASDSLLRAELSQEAIRLGRLLVELLPEEPEVLGLFALMLLHDARRPSRVDERGAIVLLEEQDRTRWDRTLIEEGTRILDEAVARRRRGPYQIQAAIAALHARAAKAEQTDWAQIAALYGALLRLWPTPIVELNAAVAWAMAEGLEHGLSWLDAIERRGDLRDYHLFYAARADLLRRAGRHEEAYAAYEHALARVTNAAERAYLTRRSAEVKRCLSGR